jgi:hypothetical protein
MKLLVLKAGSTRGMPSMSYLISQLATTNGRNSGEHHLRPALKDQRGSARYTDGFADKWVIRLVPYIRLLLSQGRITLGAFDLAGMETTQKVIADQGFAWTGVTQVTRKLAKAMQHGE